MPPEEPPQKVPLPDTVDIFTQPHYKVLRQSENLIKRNKLSSDISGRSRDEWVQMMMYERRLNEEDELAKLRAKAEQKQRMKRDLDAQMEEKVLQMRLQRQITENFACQ